VASVRGVGMIMMIISIIELQHDLLAFIANTSTGLPSTNILPDLVV